MYSNTEHAIMLSSLGYDLVMQESAPKYSTSAIIELPKILMTRLCTSLKGFFFVFTKLIQSNWFCKSNKLTQKAAQLLQRWGSRRSASSLWHENWSSWSSLVQLLAQKSPSNCRRIHAGMYFAYAGELTVPLFVTKEKLSPSPCLLQTGSARSPDITPSWGRRILLGALTEIPVQASTCARCWMYLQFKLLLGWADREHKKQQKGKVILLGFADTKGLWFVSMARELWNQSHGAKLEKHYSGSCCRCCSLSLFH